MVLSMTQMMTVALFQFEAASEAQHPPSHRPGKAL